MLAEWEGDMGLQVKIFARGLLDSLSFHRALPDLVNNPTVSGVMGKILVANAVLILGSIVFFHKGIVPFLDVLGQSAFDVSNQDHYDSFLWFAYRWLWLGPICILCYACCLSWYSQLGEALRKKSAGDQLTSSLQAVYALLVWLVAFLQLQALNVAFPWCINSLVFVAEKVFAGQPAGPLMALRWMVLHLLHLLSYCNHAVAWLLMTSLYAWYSFDPAWIAQGVAPDERFLCIHKHLAYFLGFGLPYTVLVKTTSFFIGFSAFLMLFPLSIIVASVSDYAAPYRELEVKPMDRLQVFKLAQRWTLLLIRPFSKKVAAASPSVESGRASVTKSKHEVRLPRMPAANKEA